MLNTRIILTVAIFKWQKSPVLVFLPTWTTPLCRLIKESQNQEPVSKYNSFPKCRIFYASSPKYWAKTLLRLVQNNFQAKLLLANYTAPGQESVGCRFASPWPRWWIGTDSAVHFPCTHPQRLKMARDHQIWSKYTVIHYVLELEWEMRTPGPSYLARYIAPRFLMTTQFTEKLMADRAPVCSI